MELQLYIAYVKTILLYAGPDWVNATDYHLKRLATVATKTPRLILGYKQAEITNTELYERVNLKPVLHPLCLDTVKSFCFVWERLIFIDLQSNVPRVVKSLSYIKEDS